MRGLYDAIMMEQRGDRTTPVLHSTISGCDASTLDTANTFTPSFLPARERYSFIVVALHYSIATSLSCMRPGPSKTKAGANKKRAYCLSTNSITVIRKLTCVPTANRVKICLSTCSIRGPRRNAIASSNRAADRCTTCYRHSVVRACCQG